MDTQVINSFKENDAYVEVSPERCAAHGWKSSLNASKYCSEMEFEY